MERETTLHLRNGLLLAIVVTLLFNASNLVILVRGPETALKMKTMAMDEQYYLALIREASEGHFKLGSPSLKEHRDDPSVVRYLPLLPGALMRFTGISLSSTVFLSDLLFPFLTTLILFLAWRGLFASSLEAAAATMIPLGLIFRGGMFNVINPKMVLPFAALHLALIFGVSKPHTVHLVLRGISLALLLYIYPHFFLYFTALEACMFLTRQSSLRSFVKGIALMGIPFLLIASPLIYLNLTGKENPAAADLWYRIVSPTSLPADPKMQLLLLTGIGALLFVRRREKMSSRVPPPGVIPSDFASSEVRGEIVSRERDLLLCLVSGLIVLNQSLIHGQDLMAGLHYFYLLRMFLWITGFYIVFRLLDSAKLAKQSICLLIILFCTLKIGQHVKLVHAERTRIATEFQESDTSKVLDWLNTQEGEKVVLAPDAIANLIPIYTSHYTAMNGYAGFQSGSDAELAERYILQDAIAPRAGHDASYPSIFSVHAGNRDARERTWCRITSLFQKSAADCAVPVRDFIRHYELLPMLDSSLAEHDPAQTLEFLRKYNVDVIVTEGELPGIAQSPCSQVQTIGTFKVHICS